MTPIAAEQETDTPAQHDVRWLFLLAATAAVHVGSALLFPRFAYGHFSWPAFLTCLAPMVWAVLVSSTYRSFPERVIMWAAVAGAVYWALPALAMFGIKW